MKKVLTILPAVAIALTGCISSSDDSSDSTPKTLPTDYIVIQMGEYVYEDGNFMTTLATCTDRANEAVWEKYNSPGFLRAGDNNTAEIDLTASGNKVTYEYRPLAGETFPSGYYYKSSALKDPLIEGIVLEDSYYNDVAYVNTDCLFQNLGEMQETMAEIAGVEKSSVNMGCKTISVAGLEMNYVSHTSTSVDYTLSYAGRTCSLKHEFLYAFNKSDCELAFKTYQEEYANGETKDFFNFELHDQHITASEECTQLFLDFNRATGLAKSGSESSISEKQVKDMIRAIGNRLRKGK
jgi:hypothetical protein